MRRHNQRPISAGRLKEVRDRNDNRMTFLYETVDPDLSSTGDEKKVLSFVIDTIGREIRYRYYAASCFPGKTQNGTTSYYYDAEGNLVRGAGPAGARAEADLGLAAATARRLKRIVWMYQYNHLGQGTKAIRPEDTVIARSFKPPAVVCPGRGERKSHLEPPATLGGRN